MEKTYKQGIPSGYQILIGGLKSKGSSFHVRDIAKVMRHNEVTFYLEAEPKNKADKNAIKIMATYKTFFAGNRVKMIGRIPKEVSTCIAEHDLHESLALRVHKLWVGDSGGAVAELDLLIKKSDLKVFDEDLRDIFMQALK